MLETTIKPVVEALMQERGLELSAEKIRITHIDKGFGFLGFNIRKYKGKLLIKPAKGNVKDFLRGGILNDRFNDLVDELGVETTRAMYQS